MAAFYLCRCLVLGAVRDAGSFPRVLRMPPRRSYATVRCAVHGLCASGFSPVIHGGVADTIPFPNNTTPPI